MWDFNHNWENFIKCVFEWPSDSEEAKTGIKWLDILGNHYKVHPWLSATHDEKSSSYDCLCNEIVKNICNKEDKDFGLGFIKLFSHLPTALAVCKLLIRSRQISDQIQDDKKWDNILVSLYFIFYLRFYLNHAL